MLKRQIANIAAVLLLPIIGCPKEDTPPPANANLIRLAMAILLCFSLSSVYAQTFCGTPAPDAETIHALETAAQNYKSFAQRLSGGTLDIPVRINIVCDQTNTCAIGDQEIDQIMASVNTIYAQVPMYFYECAPRNYIEHIANNTISHDSNEPVIGAKNDMANVVNIYFTNTLNYTTGSFLFGVGGYTYQGSGEPRRVFVATTNSGGGNIQYKEIILAHELGHFFQLMHTCGSYDNGTTDELVKRPGQGNHNCSTAGDRLCDTPADPAYTGALNVVQNGGGCIYPFNPPSCPLFCDAAGDVYQPLGNNIMFPKHCVGGTFNSFTQEQLNVIYNSVATGPRNFLIAPNSHNFDIVIRDTPEDWGRQPHNLSSDNQGQIWYSPDIWNCVGDPNCETHQNPTHGFPNYVRVRVRNRGCGSVPFNAAVLRLNWTRVRTGEMYPNHWVESDENTINGHPAGGIINDLIFLPELAPGESTIITQEWTSQVPNPDWYPFDTPGAENAEIYPMIGILAKVTAAGDYGSNTVPIPSPLIEFLISQNHTATINCALTHCNPGSSIDLHTICIHNLHPLPSRLDIRLHELLLDPIGGNTPDSFVDIGDILMIVDDPLWIKYLDGGSKHTGLEVIKDRTFKVVNTDEVAIKDLLFQPNEDRTLGVEFKLATGSGKNAPSTTLPKEYTFFVTHHSEGQAQPEGGGVFKVNISERQPSYTVPNTAAIPITIQPNPADKTTSIGIYMQKQESLSLYLTNIAGETHKVIAHNAYLGEGMHHIVLPTVDLPAGLYILHAQTATANTAVKMIVHH